MKAIDYKIINGGNRDAINACGRIYILFVSGSGSGDQSYWCEFHSTYKVYREKWGELIECGEIHEITGTDKNLYFGTIDGKSVSCDFLSASDIFTRIELITNN